MDAKKGLPLLEKESTEKIIGAAIEVHRVLGPGLLESVYQPCMAHEFSLRNMLFGQQIPLAVEYKGVRLDCGYRIDFVVENKVILELKAVEMFRVDPIVKTQKWGWLRWGWPFSSRK